MKKQWWHDKIAYQVYPKSFCDSNDDGIGDIQGIISKLDYLKNLGVDILWISPVYASPMVDNGYDISDYERINPMFGTMEDMDQLLEEAKKREIYVLMDLVVNHCSSEHPWFQAAIKDPDGPYGDYFYIKKSRDGKPLNNWRSYFGGSVWERVPGHENKVYYHSFAKEQPDLNWENPKLREEIYAMIHRWMKKGLSGFRVDAIMNIKKDLTWEDLPVDGSDGMGAVCNTIQRARGIGDFLLEMKEQCFEPYDALTIGEAMWMSENQLENVIGEQGYFSTIFAFEPVQAHFKGIFYGEYLWPMPLNLWKKAVFANQKMTSDMELEANLIENHDLPRGASLYIPEDDYGFYSVTALATIFMCLKGMPFLYQGQELGMKNRTWTYEEFDDLETKSQYRRMVESGYSKEEALEACNHMSRDNTRTMIPWDEVEEQKKEYASILNFYERLISFRTSKEYKEVLTYGTFIPRYEEQEHIFAYERVDDRQRLVLICNFSNENIELVLDDTIEQVVFVNYEQTTMIGNKIQLKPYEVVIYQSLR